MRILLIHRYFWPDSPPYASMLRVMAKHFHAQGHQVTVLSTQPSYTAATAKLRQPKEETLDGVRVLRRPMLPERKGNWFLRLLNVALFLWHIAAHLVSQKKYDVVFATTMPPVVAATTARVASSMKGSKFVYHCMDLYPEIGRLSGSRIMGRGPIPWALGLMDRRNCRKAWRVVVLSEDMKDTLLGRGLDASNIKIINNFSLEESRPQVELDRPLDSKAFKVFFAGNIGRFQGLEEVLEAAAKLSGNSSIEFHFLGDGAARKDLERQAASLLGRTVFFHGFMPLAKALRAMEHADLGIVSLRPGIISAAYPSKTMTYLSMGVPLLVIAEPNCSLSRLAQREKVGVTCPQGDPSQLAKVIEEAAAKKAAMVDYRANCLRVARKEFASSVVLQQWDRLLGGAQ